MKATTRRIIVYLCAAILVIIGIYNLIIVKDTYTGIIWAAMGIFFSVVGYLKIKG